LPRKKQERQYAIEASATFFVCSTSLKTGRKALEEQLIGMNTTDVKIGVGQMLVPQEKIEEDENGQTTEGPTRNHR